MKNESKLEFIDISTELYRTYVFPTKVSPVQVIEVRINEPTHLHVSKSGGHRVLDKSGKSHYITNGWIHLYWEVLPDAPNFIA
jgi:hypothetical protein